MISRRKFLFALAGAGVGGVGSELWAGNEPFHRQCALRTESIPAPAGWRGRTVLFVSDVHYGSFFGPSEAAALAQIVRAQRPDLVLLGGDLAQTPDTDLAGFFSSWSPGCPTIFTPGNHDTGVEHPSPVMEQARAAGATVLCNAAERWDGITIVGLPSALRMAQRTSLLDARGFKLVLGHEPDVWDGYRPPELLHLAGHTHGGQVRIFDQAFYLPTLGRKYVRGRFSREGDRTLIVSEGVGCTTIHLRINCPPEVVRLQFT